jgi:hypothetical protein
VAQVKLITNPKTKPPGEGPYIPVEVDGKETWFLIANEKSDGITDADFEPGGKGTKAPAKAGKPGRPG